MLVSDFDYSLPAELIAQKPPQNRASSRMLVVSRAGQRFHDDLFLNFPQYVRPGDCLILNNTRVFPARLIGRRNRASGAEVEALLVRANPNHPNQWRALVRPARRVRRGDLIEFASGLSAEVIAEAEFGERELLFHSKISLEEAFERFGRTPLPPYIHRGPNAEDRERYQTVFAEHRGSVAAPTAGLHFTEEILDACAAAGADLAKVTLHVGLGTFAPLRENEVSRVQLHEEYFEISQEASIQLARAERVLCVGTTSVRTIETAALRGGWQPLQGETNLFIHPGFSFRATGAMLTNFHLPKSSLLLLVCAFGGTELILSAYRHAVSRRYQFFSYGDCMLII